MNDDFSICGAVDIQLDAFDPVCGVIHSRTERSERILQSRTRDAAVGDADRLAKGGEEVHCGVEILFMLWKLPEVTRVIRNVHKELWRLSTS